MNHIWIKMKSIDCGVFLSKRSVWNYLDSCKIYFVLDCKSLTISFLRRIPGHRRAIAIVSNCVVVECKTAMQISRIFDDCLRIILLGIPATARTTRVETPTWGRTFCDFEETIYDFDAKIQNCKLNLIRFWCFLQLFRFLWSPRFGDFTRRGLMTDWRPCRRRGGERADAIGKTVPDFSACWRECWRS